MKQQRPPDDPALSAFRGFAVVTTDRLAITKLALCQAILNRGLENCLLIDRAQFLTTTLLAARRVQPVYPYPWSPAETAYQ
jgi:hypothetical protein